MTSPDLGSSPQVFKMSDKQGGTTSHQQTMDNVEYLNSKYESYSFINYT